MVLETDHEDFQKLLEKKDKEIRKMKKVILKLMEDLEEFRHIDERCFTIAKILEHIDNIDQGTYINDVAHIFWYFKPFSLFVQAFGL